MTQADIQHAIQQALQDMTDEQRDAFLAVADGHTWSSAARTLGISKSALQSRLRRARHHIADRLLPLLYDAVRHGEVAA